MKQLDANKPRTKVTLKIFKNLAQTKQELRETEMKQRHFKMRDQEMKSLPDLYGDKHRFRLIIMNLIKLTLSISEQTEIILKASFDEENEILVVHIKTRLLVNCTFDTEFEFTRIIEEFMSRLQMPVERAIMQAIDALLKSNGGKLDLATDSENGEIISIL